MKQKTLLLIKPNAVAHKHIGHIITIIENHDFYIQEIKRFQFTEDLATKFYIDHVGKEFFPKLVSFMCSGDTFALVLERVDAVEELRNLIGDVEPAKRRPGTIRALYGEGVTENGVHASDSVDNANREIGVVFSDPL